MAGTSGRRSRAASIQIEAIDQVNASLQDLPEKPKDNLSLREAVNLLQDEIRVALAKGYTHEDLAAIFADQGIEISALTLKRYVSSGRGQTAKAKNPTGRRGRRAKSEAIEEPEAPLELEPETVEPEVEEPTPTPSGRRRRTSAAKAQSESAQTDEATPKRTTSGRGRASTRATQSTSRTRRKSTK